VTHTQGNLVMDRPRRRVTAGIGVGRPGQGVHEFGSRWTVMGNPQASGSDTGVRAGDVTVPSGGRPCRHNVLAVGC
jgi:hypothetical protein